MVGRWQSLAPTAMKCEVVKSVRRENMPSQQTVNRDETNCAGEAVTHQLRSAAALCDGPASVAWEELKRCQGHPRTPPACGWHASQPWTSRSLQLGLACGLEPSGTFLPAGPPQCPASMNKTHHHGVYIPCMALPYLATRIPVSSTSAV